MAKQYRFANYSFQDTARGAASQEAIDAMAADGWEMHTCYPNFVEVAVMWERDVPASVSAAKKAKTAAG